MKAAKLCNFPSTTTATSSPYTFGVSPGGPYPHLTFAKRTLTSPLGGSTVTGATPTISARPLSVSEIRQLTGLSKSPPLKLPMQVRNALVQLLMAMVRLLRIHANGVLRSGPDAFDCFFPLPAVGFAKNLMQVSADRGGGLGDGRHCWWRETRMLGEIVGLSTYSSSATVIHIQRGDQAT